MTEAHGSAKPRRARIVMAFIVAPLAATLAFLVPMIVSDRLDPSAEMANMPEFKLVFLRMVLLVTWVFAFGSAIVFGLPVYYMFRRRLSSSPAAASLAGGLIALTSGLLVVLFETEIRSNAAGAVGFMASVLGSGLIAGLVFWICAFWRDTGSVKSVSS